MTIRVAWIERRKCVGQDASGGMGARQGVPSHLIVFVQVADLRRLPSIVYFRLSRFRRTNTGCMTAAECSHSRRSTYVCVCVVLGEHPIDKQRTRFRSFLTQPRIWGTDLFDNGRDVNINQPNFRIASNPAVSGSFRPILIEPVNVSHFVCAKRETASIYSYATAWSTRGRNRFKSSPLACFATINHRNFRLMTVGQTMHLLT